MLTGNEKMANTDFEKSKEWEIGAAKIAKAHGYADGGQDHAKAQKTADKTAELALQIMKLSRNRLLVNLRFLEAAFVYLAPSHDTETLEIATDGQKLYYNSIHVCRQYRRAAEIPVRDYLHVVLHCLFRHLFTGKNIRAELWDLSCDIAVENIITELDNKAFYCERQEEQLGIIGKLKEELPKLTAEHIYRYFSGEDISSEEVSRLAEAFHADDHSIWHAKTKCEDSGENTDEADSEDEDEGEKTDILADTAGNDSPEEDGEKSETDSLMDAVEGGSDDGLGRGGSNDNETDNGKPALSPAEIEDAWKEIADRVRVDMESETETWGRGAGNLQQRLRELSREKFDYARLLRRFAVMGENVEINDDEFDYIFYTYGMELYRDMPLVEPLEYRDVKKVKEFVIALDTSESVSGEMVQMFVNKTWNILKQSESFFTRVNIHIIQCGARVEEDVRINTEDELDEYIKNMVLKGFGGTDFRPVFEYVDTLIRRHEFTNFKGLVYFTDGYGTFPGNPPEYDAAFVFLDQGYELPDVPSWVIKMVLTEDEIREL